MHLPTLWQLLPSPCRVLALINKLLKMHLLTHFISLRKKKLKRHTHTPNSMAKREYGGSTGLGLLMQSGTEGENPDVGGGGAWWSDRKMSLPTWRGELVR